MSLATDRLADESGNAGVTSPTIKKNVLHGVRRRERACRCQSQRPLRSSEDICRQRILPIRSHGHQCGSGSNLKLRHLRHQERWGTSTSLSASARAVPEQYLGAGPPSHQAACKRQTGIPRIPSGTADPSKVKRSTSYEKAKSEESAVRTSGGRIDSSTDSLSSSLKLSTTLSRFSCPPSQTCNTAVETVGDECALVAGNHDDKLPIRANGF